MRLTVLGSSGGYPTPENPNTGFLFTAGGRRLQLDAGTGTLAALGRHLDFARLDALVLTHTHPDHCLDFFPLYVARRFHPDDLPRLPLLAPRGTRKLLAPLAGAELPEEAGELDRVFDFRETEAGGSAEVAGFTLRFAATDHQEPTLAVRAEAGGRSIAFTSDTGPAVDLAPFVRGVDLLLAEATFQEGQAGENPKHLTAAQAGALARHAGVGRLLLTHLWPTLDPEVSLGEAREAAGPEVAVELALAGTSIDI